jgi:hypothetical protein
MTKGQQAMAVAMIYPQPEKLRRKGSSPLVTKGQTFSSALLSQARAVLANASKQGARRSERPWLQSANAIHITPIRAAKPSQGQTYFMAHFPSCCFDAANRG